MKTDLKMSTKNVEKGDSRYFVHLSLKEPSLEPLITACNSVPLVTFFLFSTGLKCIVGI